MHPMRNFPADQLVHTYSIVARDPATGELGAAVQSHWFSVGSAVIWAEPEVGVVATQAFAEPSYGPLGLDLMRIGRPAPAALAGLLAADERREVRQVAMLDAQGRAAAHTGRETIAEAGHIVGTGFTVQANMMLKATVWPAMKQAFESAKGDLAERMLAALDAAEAEGGDIRGRQSAALIEVTGNSTRRAWADRVFDLRVDDHPEPLAELRRLVGVQRAYGHKLAADRALARGDFDAGAREYEIAERLVPDNPEFPFWHAVGLLGLGRADNAAEVFRRVFAKDRNWAALALRMARSGLIPCELQVAERAIARAQSR
jgi:uncharacterized Ntn-hydrolase superfamily protein